MSITRFAPLANRIGFPTRTTVDFRTINGVKAHGGSIISMAPAIAGGMLYITSGYGGNGMPGNLLLAFSLPR